MNIIYTKRNKNTPSFTMRIFIISVICFISAFLNSQQFERVLTIEESVGLALLNNQKILLAEQEVELLKQKLREARSTNYPQIDFNINYSRMNVDTILGLPRQFGDTILTYGFDKENYYTARASIWQVLWAGSRYRNIRKYTNVNLNNAKNNYEVVKNEVKSDVKEIYFYAVFVQEKLNFYRNLIKQTKEYIEKSNIKGQPDYVLANTNQTLSELSSDISAIEREFEIAKLNLLDIVGIELNTTLCLKGELNLQTVEMDLNKLLALSAIFNPEIKKPQIDKELTTLDNILLTSSRFPLLVAGANYQIENKKFPLRLRSWNATINFYFPLFDGGGFWARQKQKKIEKRKLIIRKAEIEDRIKMNIHISFIEYKYWQNEIPKREKEYELSMSHYNDFIDKKYSFSIEFLKVLKNLLRAKTDHLFALYNQNVAKVEIEKNIGKNLEEDWEKNP